MKKNNFTEQKDAFGMFCCYSEIYVTQKKIEQDNVSLTSLTLC